MNYINILACTSDLGNCCNDPGLVGILDTLRRMTDLLQIIVPILLMIMASIEFAKIVRYPDKKDGFNRIKNLFKAAAIVFFVPMFLDVLLNLLPSSFTLSSCWKESEAWAETYHKSALQYSSPYDEEKHGLFVDPSEYQKGVPKPVENNNSSSSSSGITPNGISPASAKGILEGAERVHTVYEQNGWAYYSDLSELRWNDINYSTNNPSRKTCCATFVGSALYAGGVFTESELNQYNYNSVEGISDLCQAHGWQKISSYSQLAAGDVVIMSPPGGGSSLGHVQIYAGNGTWYNAGSTNAIQRDNPYPSDASGRFLYAWRKSS